MGAFVIPPCDSHLPRWGPHAFVNLIRATHACASVSSICEPHLPRRGPREISGIDDHIALPGHLLGSGPIHVPESECVSPPPPLDLMFPCGGRHVFFGIDVHVAP